MPTRHDGPIRSDDVPDPDHTVGHTLGPIDACPDCQARALRIEEGAASGGCGGVGCGGEWGSAGG